MHDWFYDKIIEPMNNWADKHPWFPTIISVVALFVSVVVLTIKIVLL